MARGNAGLAKSVYLQLELLDPIEPMWPKRAAEAARKLGQNAEAALAFRRAAAIYARLGFSGHARAMDELAARLEA